MTKNERILIIIIITLQEKIQKYITADFVAMPKSEIKNLKLAYAYLENISKRYGKIEFDNSELRTAINRISNQMLKLKSTTEKPLDIPPDDFDYIALFDLISMQFDEVIEKQQLPKIIKTYLKTANTYIKKFLDYIQSELGE